jgi:hypothetical protein
MIRRRFNTRFLGVEWNNSFGILVEDMGGGVGKENDCQNW